MSLDAVYTFRVFEKIISNGKCFSPTNIQSYPTTQVSVPMIIFSDFVPTFVNDTFAFINTQPSNMQGQLWIINTKFRHEMYFADSLGRKNYRFLKQHLKPMMPAKLQFQFSVWRF